MPLAVTWVTPDSRAVRGELMNDRIARVLEHKGHDVETTALDTTVSEAVEHMNLRRIGALVVLDGERPIGIFTERDVLVRVVARGLDPKITRIVEVMTRDPITISSDATVEEAMRVITTHRCRHLPVLGAHGLCGLISIGDLTGWVVRVQQLTIFDLEDYIRAA